MNVDPYGHILPEENTTYKVHHYELDKQGLKKDRQDWIPFDENNQPIQYQLGNYFKNIKISGALSSNLSFCNGVKYKRVNNPDMFNGDCTNLKDPNIKGFAWIPCVIPEQ